MNYDINYNLQCQTKMTADCNRMPPWWNGQLPDSTLWTQKMNIYIYSVWIFSEKMTECQRMPPWWKGQVPDSTRWSSAQRAVFSNKKPCYY